MCVGWPRWVGEGSNASPTPRPSDFVKSSEPQQPFDKVATCRGTLGKLTTGGGGQQPTAHSTPEQHTPTHTANMGGRLGVQGGAPPAYFCGTAFTRSDRG